MISVMIIAEGQLLLHYHPTHTHLQAKMVLQIQKQCVKVVLKSYKFIIASNNICDLTNRITPKNQYKKSLHEQHTF